MTMAQVHDENGKKLGNVKVGDTKLQALERLCLVGKGGLYDKDDLGLLDKDCITGEGSPYVFKPSIVFSSENRTKKTRHTFDISKLVSSPLDVNLPIKHKKNNPPFMCSDEWWDCEIEIESQLESEDDGTDRVPPMALVRCSRGGKTRALKEIAHRMHSRGIGILFISFNDQTSLMEFEQEDPLQALLRRIAFSAMSDQRASTTFYDFCLREDYYDPLMFIRWLGDFPVILIVDELNNLHAITEPGTKDKSVASEFGAFVKHNFLGKEGRYLVYSSHVLSTVSAFGECLDPSNASNRHVILQELPLVENISIALRDLNEHLHGAREAIYFGLMPGMIYEKGRAKPMEGKRETAVSNYLSQFERDERNHFRLLCCSLVSGRVHDLPTPLHLLVDGCNDDAGGHAIRWVPFHLEYVMQRISVHAKDVSIRRKAAAMGNLCLHLSQSKELSGEGWEAIFVLFLMARCIAYQPDNNFLPKEWFVRSPRVEYNPYLGTATSLNQCKNWEDLFRGIQPSVDPTISVFCPTHSQFQAYDAIVINSEQNKILSIYGYRLKEGKANSGQLVETAFSKSFVVKGNPPDSTSEKNNWVIPDAGTINEFFGNSGKHWTPHAWKRLSSTSPRTAADDSS